MHPPRRSGKATSPLADPPIPDPRWRRLLLVGLPGSGKSTVGRALAAAIGWDFLDVDAELVRRTGLSIAGYFEQHGQAAFRAEEARLTAELCSRDRVVLAPGGGWIARAGSFEALPPGSAVVWLQVDPAEAVRRLAGSDDVRPLLQTRDPAATAAALLEARRPRYALAHIALAVDGRTTADLTRDIVEWLTKSTS